MDKIYGVDTRENGEVAYIVVFDDQDSADKWLHTEEGDFRTRELMEIAEIENTYADVIAEYYDGVGEFVEAMVNRHAEN